MWMRHFLGILLVAVALPSLADTNVVSTTNKTASARVTEKGPASAEARNASARRAEEVRMMCIEGRRYICGRVLQILPDGLVVDSGYSDLLKPPFNQSWVVRANVAVTKSPSLVEEKKPDAFCVGLVFLTSTPKRPVVKAYDYVVIHGYPAGEHVYAPVPGVQKTIRQFSASLERAVSLTLAPSEK
jgi:hypothetical protein